MPSIFRIGGGTELTPFNCIFKEDIKKTEIDGKDLLGIVKANNKIYVSYKNSGSYVAVFDNNLSLLKTISLKNKLEFSSCIADEDGNVYFSSSGRIIKIDKNYNESFIKTNTGTTRDFKLYHEYLYFVIDGYQRYDLQKINLTTMEIKQITWEKERIYYDINNDGVVYTAYTNTDYYRCYLKKIVDDRCEKRNDYKLDQYNPIYSVFAYDNHCLFQTRYGFLKFDDNLELIEDLTKTGPKVFDGHWPILKVNGCPMLMGNTGIFIFNSTGKLKHSCYSYVFDNGTPYSSKFEVYVDENTNELYSICIRDDNKNKIEVKKSSNFVLVEDEQL